MPKLPNLWHQERGVHSPRPESRGWKALDDYDHGGPILFLGGPKHNQFLDVPSWKKMEAYQVPDGRLQILWLYRLRKKITSGGAIHYVYEVER